jgi:hypothetical protein
VLASFVSMSAMDGQKELLKLADEISIDSRTGRKERKMQTEAKKARRLSPDEIPDSPEQVVAGTQKLEPVEVDELEDDPQRGGLSGPGSFEAAMMMFGPPKVGAPNPHGQHEVTEEG